MSEALGGGHEGYQVSPEVHRIAAEHGFYRVEDDRIVLLDALNRDIPLQRGVPPPSVLGLEHIRVGLEYLQNSLPEVALLLTRHRDGNDFRILAGHAGAGALLLDSPVSGVEAHTANPPRLDQVDPPQLHPTNKWLRAFQEEQFPWLEAKGKLMLPCEAFYTGELDERMTKMDELYNAVRADALGYDDKTKAELTTILLADRMAHRTWGIVGQFGWWQQHPVVREVLDGSTDPVPLTLGGAHEYEVEILRDIYGLPTTVLYMNTILEQEMHRYAQLLIQHLIKGYIKLGDLAVRPYF